MAKVGRPSKYKPEYCEGVLAHMSKGFSFESYAAVIGVNRDTLFEWTHAHAEFSDYTKRGQDASRYFYEKIGLMGMTGKMPGFNASSWIFSMKNRFGWRDKANIELSGKDGGPISFTHLTDEELQKEIDRLTEEAMK